MKCKDFARFLSDIHQKHNVFLFLKLRFSDLFHLKDF